jgi:hypothetical protein
MLLFAEVSLPVAGANNSADVVGEAEQIVVQAMFDEIVAGITTGTTSKEQCDKQVWLQPASPTTIMRDTDGPSGVCASWARSPPAASHN